jgi:hypothetical protein
VDRFSTRGEVRKPDRRIALDINGCLLDAPQVAEVIKVLSARLCRRASRKRRISAQMRRPAEVA